MKIEWSERYELGIDKIDTQHKRLVSIINRLEEAWREKKNNDTIKTIFQSLRDYTNYHFSFEEMAMERNRYNNIDNHKSGHTKFIVKINHLYLQYIQGDENALKSTLEYLNSWLIDHILVEDKKYVPVLRSAFDSSAVAG